eukprot:gene11986-5387_t
MEESVTLDEVKQYFGQPIHVAASFLGISMDSLRKICRQNGIKRWPSKKSQLKIISQDNKRKSTEAIFSSETLESKILKVSDPSLINERITLKRTYKSCLNQDTLIHVFSFLEFSSIRNVSLVSKYFHEIHEEELSLMKRVFYFSPEEIMGRRFSIEYLKKTNKAILEVDSYLN